MFAITPNHLRRRREKIFGPAPSHPMDSQAKARFWAELKEYNRTHREGRQHIGPYTRTMLEVLKKLLFGFHNADGTGRCFPGHERLARAVGCSTSTVERTLKTAEAHGHLDWIHRLKRVRCAERDPMLGGTRQVTRVYRTSNGYRFVESCNRQNRGGPMNPVKNKEGARLVGAPVHVRDATSAPSEQAEMPLAPRGERAAGDRARLSAAERTAIVARMDAGTATKADWAAYLAGL